MCRKLGITKLTVGDVSFEIELAFSPAPKVTSKVGDITSNSGDDKIEVDELDEESLLYWSATGTNI
jgi:16S rRNA A1518/A1519 N6-dimethyltransferase RsmA/KsgA/DIM1 with predicted DNA glycosylase/AP lyase activity